MEDVANCTPPFPSPVQVLLPGYLQHGIGAFLFQHVVGAETADSSLTRDRLQLTRKMSCRTVDPKKKKKWHARAILPMSTSSRSASITTPISKWHRGANMGFHTLCSWYSKLSSEVTDPFIARREMTNHAEWASDKQPVGKTSQNHTHTYH